ncbi:MAG TPA: hypothetical protein VMS98_05080 [Thermoanaerobaculia bacterium]|nr:hypothetical protein [Thermoanaerobaculia bacterium]
MEQPIPSEFAAFVHDIATRAFDNLGTRVRGLETPLRAVVRSWSKLSRGEKARLVDELITAAQGLPENAEEKAARRPVKRFDPEDVRKTLPAKKKKSGTRKKRS